MFDRGAPLRNRFQHRVQRLQRHFRQKSERSQIDAEQRHIDRSRDSRGRQSVPSPPRTTTRSSGCDAICARGTTSCPALFRGLLIDDDFVAVSASQARSPGRILRDFGTIGPRNDGGGFLG